MKVPTRSLHYETIRADPKASFVLRVYRGKSLSFNWHYHPELELVLITNGRGTRFVGDSVQNFQTGDLCFLGANLPHTWVSDPSVKTVGYVLIQFLPVFCGKDFFKIPETQSLSQLFMRAKQGLQISGEAHEQVAKKMISLHRKPSGSFLQLIEFMEILNTIAESKYCYPIALSGLEPSHNLSAHKKLHQVLELIHSDTHGSLTQSDVAEKIRLSPQAFSRFFKRAMGKTYMEYLQEFRISKVCRALLETDKNITEVAYELGFDNLSTFNLTFRKLKGVTPTQYRKQVKSVEKE